MGNRVEGYLPMSRDHKASDYGEERRILKAGSWVSHSGRVAGELDMSRALGDACFKQVWRRLPSRPPAAPKDVHVHAVALSLTHWVHNVKCLAISCVLHAPASATRACVLARDAVRCGAVRRPAGVKVVHCC